MTDIIRDGVTRRWSDAVVHGGVAYFVEVPDDPTQNARDQIRQVLERHFGAVVSGNAQRWVLELVPTEPRLRELVSFVQLSGQQSLVREVTIAMADGDRSVMKIEPVKIEPVRPASAAASN